MLDICTFETPFQCITSREFASDTIFRNTTEFYSIFLNNLIFFQLHSFTGHDTTSSGMGFTVWWLGQMEECQKKVHKELDSIFGELYTPLHVANLEMLVNNSKDFILRWFRSTTHFGRPQTNGLSWEMYQGITSSHTFSAIDRKKAFGGCCSWYGYVSQLEILPFKNAGFSFILLALFKKKILSHPKFGILWALWGKHTHSGHAKRSRMLDCYLFSCDSILTKSTT